MLREAQSTYVPHAANEADDEEPFGDPYDSSNEYNQTYSERFENTESTANAEGRICNLNAAAEPVQNCMRYFWILFYHFRQILVGKYWIFDVQDTYINPKGFVNIAC